MMCLHLHYINNYINKKIKVLHFPFGQVDMQLKPFKNIGELHERQLLDKAALQVLQLVSHFSHN